MKIPLVKIARYIFLSCLLSGAWAVPVWGNDDIARFDSITIKIEACVFSRAAKAQMMVAELQAISKKHPGNINLAVRSLHSETRVNCLHDISDSALTGKVLNAINEWQLDKHPLEKALMDNSLALCFLADGNYAKAFSTALQAFEQFLQLEEGAPYMTRILSLLGNICLKTHDTKMAIEYYKQAFDWADPEQREYYSILVVLYTHMAANMESHRHYVDSLETIIPMLAQKPDTGLLITVYFNLGTLYSKKGNIDKGYNYYLLSKEYAEKHNLDNHAFSFMSQQNLGVLCRMRGEFSEAFQYAYTAKNAADTSCNPEQLSMVFALLSNLHMETDNIDSAYFYLAKHNAIQQELIMNSKTTEVYKDYISIYLESAQKELTIAEQEIIIRNRRFVLMAVLVVATILVVVLLLIMMRQKKHSMGKRIEQEKQIQGLQKEKIEMQVRELTSYSVLLSNKNHSFQQISELVRQLPSSETKEVGEIKKKLADIIKTDLNTESERNNFMLHFEQVHPRFFEKLKERSNELTEHNLHLCAYFRIGMSSKQIAQILNVSFDTIRINRYRLRKKLRLSEDEDLYDFLRNL